MSDPVIIKKYPNRRLYDTERSAYVVLDDVARMIRGGRHVTVTDAKTGQDVTAFILTQILMEQAKKDQMVLPVSLLHLIIRFGETALNEFFEKYLEQAIQSYLAYKKTMEEQFRICLELGMDLSSIAERTLSQVAPLTIYMDPSRKTQKP